MGAKKGKEQGPGKGKGQMGKEGGRIPDKGMCFLGRTEEQSAFTLSARPPKQIPFCNRRAIFSQ